MKDNNTDTSENGKTDGTLLNSILPMCKRDKKNCEFLFFWSEKVCFWVRKSSLTSFCVDKKTDSLGKNASGLANFSRFKCFLK